MSLNNDNDNHTRLLPENIIVLAHGNNGSPSDFDLMEKILMQKYADDDVLVIKSAANCKSTRKGIEIGGQALAQEIIDILASHKINPHVTRYKFSMVGHSLGGLYGRYSLVYIMDGLNHLNIEYVDFVTICTPHLGSRRPSAKSTWKNLLRYGIHSVLAIDTIYGRTGADLLGKQAQEETQVVEGSKPVLESMSEPDSLFLFCLNKFRHRTLVAMTDGDVVVPYASASIRNFNPYPSNSLSGQFSTWRWYIQHSGFSNEDEDASAFVQKLDQKVDASMTLPIQSDESDHDFLTRGLNLNISSQRYQSEDGMDCDNKREVEFSFEIAQNLHSIPWRRIDLTVEPVGVQGRFRLHDWPIGKAQVVDSRSKEFVELLCEMIGFDHHLRSWCHVLAESTNSLEENVQEELEGAYVKV